MSDARCPILAYGFLVGLLSSSMTKDLFYWAAVWGVAALAVLLALFRKIP